MRYNAAKAWSGTFKELEQKRQKLKGSTADHRKGAGRQVSFPLNGKRAANYTDWMKHRVDNPPRKSRLCAP